MMAYLDDLAEKIRSKTPDWKCGSMRLWGQSFGRPGEDGHILIGCEVINNGLRISLEDDECLAVWNPLDVKIASEQLRIESADSMRFTSYYQGRPKLPENILYRDYALQQALVRFRTNEPWIMPGSGSMHEATAILFPAVEFIFGPQFS